MASYGSLITEVLHPFGRSGTGTTGIVSSTGAIYGPSVTSSATASTWGTVESVTVNLPTNAMITEIEYGLTMGGWLTTTTAGFELKYQITDVGGSSYDSILPSTDLVGVVAGVAGTFTDVTYSGKATPSAGTYFTGHGAGLTIVASNACDSTTKCAAAMKQSSYVSYTYYLIG